MEWIRFAFSAISIMLGLAIFIIGIFGVYKFKFVLNRMHAAALLDTTGLFLIVLGVAIARGFDSNTIKLLAIVGFLWLTSPLSAHFISKVEYITDEKLNDEIQNELAETMPIEEKELEESKEKD